MTPKPVELPKGSGRIAIYDDVEQALMKEIVKHHERTGDTVISELLVLHDMKVEFGVNLVADAVEL